MRDWIFKLIIVSILFVSIEGVGERVDDMDFHKTHHAHTGDASGNWFPDNDGDDHSGSSCEHFCHFHTVGMVSQLSFMAIDGRSSFEEKSPLHRIARIAEPPTPPPNI